MVRERLPPSEVDVVTDVPGDDADMLSTVRPYFSRTGSFLLLLGAFACAVGLQRAGWRDEAGGTLDTAAVEDTSVVKAVKLNPMKTTQVEEARPRAY